MKNLLNFVAVFAMLNTLTFMLGCSTTAINITEDDFINIERIASKSASVIDVAVFRAGSELSNWGSVKRHHSGRAPMKGHVDVYLIDPTGKVVVTKIVPYHRTTPKKGVARFNFGLDFLPQPNSTLRIIHHDAPIHEAKHTGI